MMRRNRNLAQLDRCVAEQVGLDARGSTRKRLGRWTAGLGHA